MEKVIDIDLDANEGLCNVLKNNLQKNKCTDFFKDTIIYKNGVKYPVYVQKSSTKFV